MEIREVDSKEVLNSLVARQPRAQFLQSWQWGEFQKSINREVWRLGIFEGEQLVGAAQIIKMPLPLGRHYFYCPRGPIIDAALDSNQFTETFKILVKAMSDKAKEAGGLFIRIEPPLETNNKKLFDQVAENVAMEATHFVQPQDTIYIDLKSTEDELLQGMHQKTRYNIHLAERKGVVVRVADKLEDIQLFNKLNEVTTQRDRFRSHPGQYYQAMLNALRPSGFMKLFLASIDNEVVAASLVAFFGDTATYVHGASSDSHRNVMAPHLLQWSQIQQAKKSGHTFYDLWGVVPSDSDNTNHSWAGITRFKKGFGGQEVSWLGAYDLILDNFWYKLYKIARGFRKI